MPGGITPGDVRTRRPALSDLTTPLVTVDESAIAHNIDTMRTWCERAGVGLAPHGKTTMNRVLWQRQLDAGAWGITVATPWQLSVALGWRIPRIMLANALVQPAYLRLISAALRDTDTRIVVWADSLRAVEIMDATLREAAGTVRPLEVLVELGQHGGRTGTRTHEEAIVIAAAISASPVLALAGVAGYEGALAHHGDEASLAIIRGYLNRLADLDDALRDSYDPRIESAIVTAGGSAYFDVVAEVLSPRHAPAKGREVLMRSGAYISHDDGFYRGITPLGRSGAENFRSAIHGWSTVVSRPEPGIALLDGGKRDLPFDEGLPEVQGVRRFGQETLDELPGASVTAMNDQHTFLALPEDSTLRVGDVVRLGLSHPCTTFDKWRALIVIDDVRAERPLATDVLYTEFG
ncbi:D-serine deaminase-like pyridoxal phosphate-dependent protein [Mycetocola sp. BIGb0189]|uniref:alanine racemase n=1 Tax=Mycetocola sp. BIGb0189 TaxID=2940604 RepID=UPI002168F5FA|nr:alanine racemase [Mycetocola sp. BIGb0189]MCS4276554.1 D-serine deaminase-like pyridoxal phosphate-dependent protein [Mycetocola sp. BIGb0189]